MKVLPRILWWAVYIVIALFLQQQFPGLDALTPGFLIALQQRKTGQTVWLFLLFTLIQEGAGNLDFGMAMLWYGGQIFIVHMSSRLFLAENILFVSVMSASLGAYYCVLFWLICALQDIPLDYMTLLRGGLIQAMGIPTIWGVTWLLMPKAAQHAH